MLEYRQNEPLEPTMYIITICLVTPNYAVIRPIFTGKHCVVGTLPLLTP
jgi:hypothetical protein